MSLSVTLLCADCKDRRRAASAWRNQRVGTVVGWRYTVSLAVADPGKGMGTCERSVTFTS